jgi:hypothetical protein
MDKLDKLSVLNFLTLGTPFTTSAYDKVLFAGVKGAVEVAIVADICKKYKGPIV